MYTHALDVMMIGYALRLMEGLGVVPMQIYGEYGDSGLRHCCVDLVIIYYMLIIVIFISISIIYCCFNCSFMFRNTIALQRRSMVVLGTVRTIHVTPSNREGLV